jgi:Transglycosylase-like domain
LTAVLTTLILMLSPTRQNQDQRWKVVQPYNAKLERMAMCESTKRWHIVKHVPGDTFYGGLQFNLSTWKSVGGKSYPHLNSKLEQKFRAVKLIKRRGYQPWPICGSA